MDESTSAKTATDALADMLFGLDPGSLRTNGITSRITREIVAWAVARSWAVRTEAKVRVPGTDGEKLGFVDVVVHRPGASEDLAIEIDSADKAWSLMKLQHAAAAGMRAIWVRWGDDEWAGTYDDVDVIQLRIPRAPDHRRSRAAQLSFWQDGVGGRRAPSVR